MVLSVIIVSYNVKYFLEQCLCSVQRAAGYDVEVIVVDNHSSDGTVEYLSEKFPFARFISNGENVGFAKANNQALQKARGEYVLFLNPDTIIPEDIFTKCIAFMQSHADAGALGVRMIDGSGRFLKESKRGFPSPWVAFCKMSGLTKIFPHSKTFARYYLGHLPEQQTNVVDALAGACLFVRKDLLNKIGGFDEQFFMYAEDIDLSFRVQQAGYKNYYFPEVTIIHFKGESTVKDKLYIKYFYKAMVQFVRKHFRGGASVIYIFMLEFAIKLRAALKIAFRFFNKNMRRHRLSGKVLIVGEQKVIQKLGERIKSSIEFSPLYYIAGDPIEKSLLEEYDTIIFCESKSFTFKNIIQIIDYSDSNSQMNISAAGSDSIAGSSSESRQGDAIGLRQLKN